MPRFHLSFNKNLGTPGPCLFEHRIPDRIRLRYKTKISQILLEFDVMTFHLPEGVLKRLQILPRSSPKSSPYGLLFVYKCVDTLLTCGYIRKIYHLRVQAVLSFNLWQTACRMHCRLLIPLSLRSFISSWVHSPPPGLCRHESFLCSSHRYWAHWPGGWKVINGVKNYGKKCY